MSADKWQAVIFDLDDTLYPEQSYVMSGFRAVAEWADLHLGISHLQGFSELQKLFNDGVRGNTFDQWLAMHGIDNKFIPNLVKVYREHFPHITPYPDAVSLLDILHPDFLLGVISDGYLKVQQNKLKALGLEKYFDAILFTDKLGRTFWKPHSRPFEVMLEMLRISDPERAVYIGDNPTKDFLGAKRIGIKTIWLRLESGEYTSLEPLTIAHAPDAQVSSFSQLKKYLLDNFNGK